MTLQDSFSAFAADLRRFIADCAGSPEEPSIDGRFNGLALRLFSLQYGANTAYRNYCAAVGTHPGAVTDWTEIPAVPTAGFKDLDLTCIAEGARTRVFHSSGTTSHKQSRHFHTEESLSIYEASIWPWFARHLLPDDAAPDLLILTPSPAQAPHSSLAHMMEVVQNRLRKGDDVFCASPGCDGSWGIDGERASAMLQASARSARPLMVLGPAFSFVHLFDEMKAREVRVSLPPGSRAMETGGYKGRSRVLTREELHRGINELLGVAGPSIVSEYGMSELSSQGYDLALGKPGRRVFRFPPWAKVRIVSPETWREVAEGVTGLIRVCDLANVYSVMYVQTEDLGTRRTEGFELMGRAVAAEERGCSLMLK